MMLIILSVFLIFIVSGSVSAAEDDAVLSQDIAEVVSTETTDEILTSEVSSAGNNSGLKELEKEDMLGSQITVEGKTFEDIQNAIDNANEGDTIYLDGVYTGSGKAIVISKNNLTIIGKNNATLDAKELSGLINGTGNHTTLKNIKFINSKLEDGLYGGIDWTGDYGTLINSTFENNKAQGACAILWNGANGEISNSQFINNTGENVEGGNSGAIRWTGINGTIINSAFINNSASTGGAITWLGSNGTLLNSTFLNNTADSASAVYSYNTNYTENFKVENCTFINNINTKHGSLMFYKSSYGTITNCRFVNNSGYSDLSLHTSDFFKIDKCTFLNNTAEYGGGIYIIVFYENNISYKIHI